MVPSACYTIPYHTIPYHTLPYTTLPFPTLPYPTLTYPTGTRIVALGHDALVCTGQHWSAWVRSGLHGSRMLERTSNVALGHDARGDLLDLIPVSRGLLGLLLQLCSLARLQLLDLPRESPR